MHFLDRTGRVRVVGTAGDERQLQEAIRQLEPDAVVASAALVPARGDLNASTLFALDTTQSVGTLRRAIRAGRPGSSCGRRNVKSSPSPPFGSDRRSNTAWRVGPRGGRLRAPRRSWDDVRRDPPRGRARETRMAGACSSTSMSCSPTRRAAVGVPADEEVRTVADLLPLEDEVSPRHVEEVLWRHPQGFGVLLAPGDELGAVQVRGRHYRSAVSAVRRTCDVVVLHVPRGLDEISRGPDSTSPIGSSSSLGLDVLSFRDAKRAIAAAGARRPMRVRRQPRTPFGDLSEGRRARVRNAARSPSSRRTEACPRAGPRAAAPDAGPSRRGSTGWRAGSRRVRAASRSSKKVRSRERRRYARGRPAKSARAPAERVDARELDGVRARNDACASARRRSRSCAKRCTSCRRARSRSGQ